ncbi:MAG TPA: PDZ domain-containing protein, partial [Alphaproteobacteria bacterium]|nr:PDZ domain-containing protein [Alphaproteobacteria bacterium]
VVKPLIEAALNGTDVKRPWLGITCQALTPEIASSLGLNYLTGAIVSNVHPLSPLKDHLQDGDVIVAINTKPISSSEEIDFILNTHKIGDKVSINFIRRGKAETLELILEEAPSLKTETTFEVTESKYLKGVVLAQSKNSKGMIVIDILKDSAALSLGIEKGDVLLKINTIDVSSMQDVKTALSKGVHGISLVIDKNGQIVNLRVQF